MGSRRTETTGAVRGTRKTSSVSRHLKRQSDTVCTGNTVHVFLTGIGGDGCTMVESQDMCAPDAST